MKKLRGRKRKGIFKNSSGVTLFEVMIALAFFAIIITPVMRTFVSSIKTNKESREVMTATDVATTIMEGITSKSYEEVCKALRMVPGGFHTPTSETDTTANAQYAFSSINNNYYNEGGTHVAPNCMLHMSELDKFDGNYQMSATYSVDEATNCFNGQVNDLDMCAPAISHLHTIFGDNPDASTFQLHQDEYAENPDKMLYFGFSHDRYPDTMTAKGVAKSAYMLYTGIKKNNLYFDATVTLVPRAENSNSIYTGGSNTENSEYFVYDVTVKVYAYRFDPKTGTWVERFDPETGTFMGAPAAVMKSGIPNKNLNL